jgi:hypothetical protein
MTARRRFARRGALLACVALLALPGCGSGPRRPPGAPEAPPADEEPLAVQPVQGEIVVAAWAEPSHLGPGGGSAQILVRVQRRGGTPLAGVEVRLATSVGSLYSEGRVLTTDSRGMTRDRLTTRKEATVTLNAGGTRYRFQVPVDPRPD